MRSISFQNDSDRAYGLHAHPFTTDSEEKHRVLDTHCLVMSAFLDEDSYTSTFAHPKYPLPREKKKKEKKKRRKKGGGGRESIKAFY